MDCKTGGKQETFEVSPQKTVMATNFTETDKRFEMQYETPDQT